MRRIQALVEPQIHRLPGLVDYYLLEVSPDQITSISLFDNKGHADMANGPIDFWLRKALDGCMQGLPEISAGPTNGSNGRQAGTGQGEYQQMDMEPLMGII